MTDASEDLNAGAGGPVLIRRGPGVDPVAAVDAAAPADVVLLAAGARLFAQGAERLARAAAADLTGATASALADPDADAAAAARLALRSPLARPTVPAPGGPAVLVRRAAIELAGGPVCGPSGELCDGFARRCVQAGLAHVIADDVLAAGPQPWPAAEPPSPPSARRPAPQPAPLVRALAARRRATGRLTVAVDARPVGGPLDGTRTHVLELVAALGRVAPGQVTALVEGAESRALLDALPGVEARAIAERAPVRHDVLHRPFQLSTPADLSALAPWAQRLVVTHQDLIGYRRADYFPSPEDWISHRALTRRALAAADHVVFPSEHARAAALAEELVEPDRATVVRHGVDHVIGRSAAVADADANAAALPIDAAGGPVIVCLGADYRHKNRPFVLRVVEELQRRHGWEGRLVLCGPRVRWGSSHEQERALLDASPRLAAAVDDLGPVSEALKARLLDRASLVAYPTVAEGFGFVPFEAADHDRPCLWAPGTAIGETLDDRFAPIVPWDVAATAENALELIVGGRARDEQLQAIAAAAAGLHWDATAAALMEVYAATADRAPSPATAAERESGLMGAGLSEDAARLVGPGGLLPRELERPLLALAARPRLARPLYAVLALGYRWSARGGD